MALLPVDKVLTFRLKPQASSIPENRRADRFVGRKTPREISEKAVVLRRQKRARRSGIGGEPLAPGVAMKIIGERVKRTKEARIRQMQVHGRGTTMWMSP